MGSWYHTHAQAKSEMWVLSQSYGALLPTSVIERCHATVCARTGQAANGTTGPYALPLHDTGYAIANLQAHVRAAAEPTTALRCAYRSTADRVGMTLWGRQSERTVASRDTCDRWVFQAGQPITLLAFNYPQAGVMQQHIRWFPVIALSIPKPMGAFAGFRSERSAGGGDGSAGVGLGSTIAERPEEDKADDWMEFMG